MNNVFPTTELYILYTKSCLLLFVPHNFEHFWMPSSSKRATTVPVQMSQATSPSTWMWSPSCNVRVWWSYKNKHVPPHLLATKSWAKGVMKSWRLAQKPKARIHLSCEATFLALEQIAQTAPLRSKKTQTRNDLIYRDKHTSAWMPR